MISKLQLQAIIEKYHLNGQIENVKWEIDANGKLTINFTAPTREMLGTVIYNGLGSILILKVKAPNDKSETNNLLCLSEHFEE